MGTERRRVQVGAEWSRVGTLHPHTEETLSPTVEGLTPRTGNTTGEDGTGITGTGHVTGTGPGAVNVPETAIGPLVTDTCRGQTAATTPAVAGAAAATSRRRT